MQQITKIVVPVDLEKNTAKLVEFAIYMANRLDGEIVFFHAVEFLALGEMALGNFSYDDYNSARVTRAESMLRDIVEENSGKCRSCDSTVVVGDIVDEIVGYARDHDAGMIIIGTHGKRGLEKILLGSVAERVLKHAPCPVLVMNPYR